MIKLLINLARQIGFYRFKIYTNSS